MTILLKNENMRISEVRSIKATWLFGGDGYVYESVPETLVTNDRLETIRFELGEVDGEDSNFEMVIQRNDDGHYHFKTDYYDEPAEELSVKAFQSENEMILFYDGRHGIAYFHLIRTD